MNPGCNHIVQAVTCSHLCPGCKPNAPSCNHVPPGGLIYMCVCASRWPFRSPTVGSPRVPAVSSPSACSAPAPAPPQGAPGGSGRLDTQGGGVTSRLATPRCTSQSPSKSPSTAFGLAMQVRPHARARGRAAFGARPRRLADDLLPQRCRACAMHTRGPGCLSRIEIASRQVPGLRYTPSKMRTNAW